MPLLAETLSRFWESIQGSLFPWLEQELGEMSEKQRALVSIFECIGIEKFFRRTGGWSGRPEKDRVPIARAFVAKAVYNMGTTRQLLDRLLCDVKLRRLCGWERQCDVPSEATFSRAFAEFAKSRLPEMVHAALIEKYEAPRLVGHISRDSTEIEGRERRAKKATKEKRPRRKLGRPKKGEQILAKPAKRLERQRDMTLEEMLNDLPRNCDSSSKLNSKGLIQSWSGYKLHLDAADGQIPISCILTSASVHDSQVALPLAKMTASRVTSLYDLMDAAYDSQIIRDHSRSLGHQPVIDYNARHGREKREFAPHEAQRYKERTTVERVFARLKDEFGGRAIRVRGAPKVMASLMFGVLALTADAILRLVS